MGMQMASTGGKFFGCLIASVIVATLSSPAHAIQSAAQINPDDKVERVTVSEEGVLYAWNKYGDVVSGWPVDKRNGGEVFVLPPRLIDIDYDFQDEILAVGEADNGVLRFHVFKGDGSELPYLSFVIDVDGGGLIATPVIADVNHDSALDIVYATTKGKIHVIRPDFTNAPNMLNLNVGGSPRIAVGDPDNDGAPNLFATTGNKIYVWGEDPRATGVVGRLDFYTLTTGEQVLGDLAIADLSDDGIPEIAFTTTKNRLVVLSAIPGAPPVLNMQIPQVTAISGVLIGDVDVDGEPEVLFATNTNVLMAFNLNGAPVANFSSPLNFGDSIIPSVGLVADDSYTGLLIASTGEDHSIIYRSKLGYSELAFGDYAHFFDPRADLELVEFVRVADIFANPLVFTPNGDGINDTVGLRYHLSMDAKVTLDVYDNHHRRLARVFENIPRSKGFNEESWDGKIAGVPITTGRYLLKLGAKSPDDVYSYGEAVSIAFGVKAEIDSPFDLDKKDGIFPTVYGAVDIYGTATDPNIGEGNLQADFKAYKLYYRPGDWRGMGGDGAAQAGDAGSSWLPIPVPIAHQSPTNISNEPADAQYPWSNVSVRAIQHGLLGSFDTTNQATTPNGIYTILLKTIDSNGNDPAKISFDMLVVQVANPVAIGPFNPLDRFDPRNPDNPKYTGPQLTRVELSSYNLSNLSPTTAITYEIGRLSDGWGRENAHVEIDIIGYNGGNIGPVAAAFLFKNMAPGAHTFNWSGQNNLGRNLAGGDYLVRVTANATDGSGSSSKDAPQAVHIERGFAASDNLRVVNDPGSGTPRFTATPNPLYPYNFDPVTGLPETTAIHYELTKEAKIDLYVFDNQSTNDPNSNNGAAILKSLRRDVVSKNGTVSWDGTNDAGEILPTGRPYYVKLIAEDIALGQDAERIAMAIEVGLEKAAAGPVGASITNLVGEDDISLPHDANPANDFPMNGSPSFFWRGRGVGYLEAGFDYTIEARGDEWSREMQPALTRQYPLYVQKFFCWDDCDFWGDCYTRYLLLGIIGHLDRKGSTMNAAPFSAPDPAYFEQIGAGINTSYNEVFGINNLYLHRTSADRDGGNSFRTLKIPASSPNISNLKLHEIYMSSLSFATTAEDISDPPDELCTHYTPPRYITTGPVVGDMCNPVMPNCPKDFRCIDYMGTSRCIKEEKKILVSGNPEYDELINSGVLFSETTRGGKDCAEGEVHPSTDIWVCGNTEVQAIYSTPKLEAWGWNISSGSVGPLRSDTHDVNSSVGSYSGTVGSGMQGRYGAAITDYKFSISDFWMNGQALSGSSNDGSPITLAQLTAWLSGGNLYADLQPHVFRSADHDIFIDSADNMFPAADWIYMRVAPPGIGAGDSRYVDLVTKQTGLVNIYGEYLANHQRGQDPGTGLYTFSDIVRITDWSEQGLVYPDGQTNDAFVVMNDPRDIDANGSIDSNNVREHNLKMRLRATGNPRRFLEVRGGVGTEDYRLDYYDSHAATPRWVSIAKAPPRARARGVLGFWDVTDLNGNNYTVRLRVTDGGNMNEDSMNVAIGTPMDRLGGRIDSTFGRASLIFQPDSIADDRLITINTVDPKREEAIDYRLPTGIPPIGPIFDIKPDDIEINRNYPVDMVITYTCEELRELLTVGPFNWNPDVACNQTALEHLTVYNLVGDGILEPLFTDVHFDAGQNIYRFRATLDHFSQYMLGQREAGFFVIESPPKGEIQKGVVTIEGRIEDKPRDPSGIPKPLADISRLTVSFYPKGNPGALVQIASFNGGVNPEFSIPWDASLLNGNFILRFEAEGPNGVPSKYEWLVAIDNTPGKSNLIIDGQLIPDGGRVRASFNSIVEISSTDDQGNSDWQSGLSRIEFAWDGAQYATYIQPFTLSSFALGEHSITYRVIDNKENTEADRTATVEVAETITQGEIGNTDISLSIGNPNLVRDARTWVGPSTEVAISTVRGDVADIMYSNGDPIFAIYEGPFNFADHNEGLYLIQYYSVDVFGVRSELKSKQVILDTTPPATTLTMEGESLESGTDIFVNVKTILKLETKDGGFDPAGLDRIEYKLGSSAWQIYAGPINIAQTTALQVRSFDKVGNEEAAKTYNLRFDDVAPNVVTRSLPTSISPNGDGRFDTAEFAFAASDNFAKRLLVDIELITDNGDRIPVFSRREFEPGDISLVWDGRINGDLVPEGVYTYAIKITDEEGNDSDALGGTIVVDVTAPQVAIVGSNVVGFSPNGDQSDDILTVKFTISDNLFAENIETALGIVTGGQFEVNRATKLVSIPPNEQAISWNGKNVQDNPAFDGSYSFELTATDPAGNRSVPQIGQDSSSKGMIVIDRSPPDTKIVISGPTFTDETKIWLGNDAKVVLDATDPEPGAGVDATFYSLDAGGDMEYRTAFGLAVENHDYVMNYWSRDMIGNIEGRKEKTLRSDTTPPFSTYTIGDPNEKIGDDTYVGSYTEISLSSDDGEGVGVKIIEARLDGVEYFGRYDRPITFDNLEDGLHTIFYRATDELGNIEETKSLRLHLDQTPPKTDVVIDAPKYSAEGSDVVYIDKDTVINFEVASERDDIAKTEYSFDDKTWLPAGPITIGAEGEYAIYYRSTDRLDNVEDIRTQRLVVDNSPPEMSVVLGQVSNGTVRYVTPGTLITLGASDVPAGSAMIEYSIDGGLYQKYSGPFALGNLAPGEHSVVYRAVDNLGHVSTPITISVTLVDIKISRRDFVMPRVLIYMLQTFDLLPSTPRPNETLLRDLMAESAGYWRMTDNLDEFIGLMRSDKFTTYVFATDAYVVNFSDDAKIRRMFRELSSRIHKGESFVSMIGYSAVNGSLWDKFISGMIAADDLSSYFTTLPVVAQGMQSLALGRGRVVHFAADLGRIASTDSDAIKTPIADLIDEIRPKADLPNAGEIKDTAIVFENPSERGATIRVREHFPQGFRVETKSTGEEVAATTREYDLTLPAMGHEEVDYLLRLPANVSMYELDVATSLLWDMGIKGDVNLASMYDVEATLGTLLQMASDPKLASTAASPDAVQGALTRILQRIALDPGALTDAEKTDLLIDEALDAIDAAGPDGTAGGLRSVLDEIVENIGLQRALALGVSVSVSAGDLNDPASFHGESSSSAGGGGCSLVMRGAPMR